MFSIFSITSLVTISVMSQSINGGIKAGLNISNVKAKLSSGSISGDALLGLHAGLFLKAMVSEKFGIQPELLYSQQGNGKNADKERINYFNVHLMGRYQLSKVFNLELGPQLGFLLSAKDNDGNDISDVLNGMNLSIAFGLGVELPEGFIMSARYVAGVSNDVDLGPNGFRSSDLKLTQSNIMFSLGYKLFGQKE